MAVTDLTGTTWYFNTQITSYANEGADINFTSNGVSYTRLRCVEEITTDMTYSSSGGGVAVYEDGYWFSEAYRTINITGGSDVTNQSLITWLQANATQQTVTNETYLTNTEELTSVADAIRTKGGTSASLTYPTGFVTAIQNLPSAATYDVTNANATDVSSGKTFYKATSTSSVTKTTGSLTDNRSTGYTIDPGEGDMVQVTSSTTRLAPSSNMIIGGTTKGVSVNNAMLTDIAGLDASILKSGETVFGITGTYTGSGIDPSATTATPAEVLDTVSFYMSDGTFVSGSIPSQTYYQPSVYGTVVEQSGYVSIDMTDDGNYFYPPYVPQTRLDKTMLAMAIGLISAPYETTSDKIVQGQTILGISGTGGGSSDLTGTTWQIKNSYSELDCPWTTVTYNINFTSNGNNYTSLKFDNYNIYYNTTTVFGPLSGPPSWTNQNYRTIAITGGTDTTNSALISWLQTYATQQ